MRARLMLAALAVVAAGCSKASTEQSSSGPRRSTGTIDAARAKQIFDARCATCHGPNGDGNGPAAIALDPKPRNYHDKDWQKKVTDDDLEKTITLGGGAVGKSPAMPANPDLASKPEVIAGLVALVRDFGK